MYRPPPPSSPQEKSENAVNQSKILLRFFLRRGEVCTQATRRSLGLSPIGSTQIFSSKLPVSLTKKQISSSLWTLCHIGSYHGTKIPWEQTNSNLFTDAEDLLTAGERGLVWGKDCLVCRPHDCARSMRFGSLGPSEPFVSDTSPKCIDRRTRQGKRENRL